MLLDLTVFDRNVDTDNLVPWTEVLQFRLPWKELHDHEMLNIEHKVKTNGGHLPDNIIVFVW